MFVFVFFIPRKEGAFWWSAGVDRPSKSREERTLFLKKRTRCSLLFLLERGEEGFFGVKDQIQRLYWFWLEKSSERKYFFQREKRFFFLFGLDYCYTFS